MAPITVEVQSRSGRTLASVAIDTEATIGEFKKAFHAQKRKYYPSRQRFNLLPTQGEARGQALEEGKHISDYGLKEGSVLQFKDLGPQIGYANVFFWEYFGPLAVYPLFYFFPNVFYPSFSAPREHQLAQTLALGYWSFHYTKRILETFYVHRFGHATMPIFNLFRNCSYYWLSAAFVSYFVNHPLYTAPAHIQSVAALALALVCQLANFNCHLILASLRKPGEKDYKIPRGFLFNFVTCANYTVEIYGWLLFTVATQTAAAGVFMTAGAYQMVMWALGKHRRLRKIFDGKDGKEKYPRRWVILPPFL